MKKDTIKNFLSQKIQPEYSQLGMVIKKLHRFHHQCIQNPEKSNGDLKYPNRVMDLNFLAKLQHIKIKRKIEIRPMTKIENGQYRQLLGDKMFDDGELKFHDSNIE